MPPLLDPIHTALICGTAVRFFAAPTGRDELPWHSLDDLYRAMKLPRDVRRELLHRTRSFPQAEIATVATVSGLTVIQSHSMAQGVVGAAIEIGAVARSFEGDYVKAGMTALDILHAGLDQQERFARLAAMAHQGLGVSLCIVP